MAILSRQVEPVEGEAARIDNLQTELRAPTIGFLDARLTPLVVAQACYKIDATTLSVTTGGLTQRQINDLSLKIGAWCPVAVLLVLVSLGLACLSLSADDAGPKGEGTGLGVGSSGS